MGKMSTIVNMREVNKRLRSRLKAALKANEVLMDENHELQVQVVDLRQKLRRRSEIELPEFYLEHVFDRTLDLLAEGFANKALQQGADIPARYIQRVARMLMDTVKPFHTVFTLDQRFVFEIQEMLADGEVQFEFSTRGPVSARYTAGPADLKELRFHRQIAASPDQKYYKLDEALRYVGDYSRATETALKPKSVFDLH